MPESTHFTLGKFELWGITHFLTIRQRDPEDSKLYSNTLFQTNLQGQGVERDAKKAKEWIAKSASQENEDAVRALQLL